MTMSADNEPCDVKWWNHFFRWIFGLPRKVREHLEGPYPEPAPIGGMRKRKYRTRANRGAKASSSDP